MKIDELNLKSFLIEALHEQEIETLMPIQEKAILPVLNGKNVVMKARTGSGKTLAFLLPSINNIDVEDKAIQVLCITPTRELAIQITNEARKLTNKVEGYKVAPLVGGTNFERQIINLKKSARIVVGTPGRLVDHIDRRSLKLKRLKYLIIDEADEMLQMGFKEEVMKVFKAIKNTPQIILCSATFDKKVNELVKDVVNDYEYINVEVNNCNDSVTQEYVYVHQDKKYDALLEVIKLKKAKKAIIFCNTKAMVDKLQIKLQEDNIKTIALHGDKDQKEREIAMDAIKKSKVNYLIATDVAARGIDIKDIDYVFNYDIPLKSIAYIHRIGRSGRRGELGKSVTLVNKRVQLPLIKDIIKETNNEITELKISLTRDDTRKSVRKSDNKPVMKTEKKYVKEDDDFKKKKSGKNSKDIAKKSFSSRNEFDNKKVNKKKSYNKSNKIKSSEKRNLVPKKESNKSGGNYKIFYKKQKNK